MANTYTLINSTSLSSSAASVTFSAIPATYDDLVLRVSARTDLAGNIYDWLTLQFNSDAGTTFSGTALASANGSTVFSQRTTNSTFNRWEMVGQGNTAAVTTANTFGNVEIYIPSYRVSQNKPYSSHFVTEDNDVPTYNGVTAALWRNTAAITSMTINKFGTNFVSGSTFWLYGIANS